MRQAFAHQAMVVTAPNGDDGAPGAAITVALCGHWEHGPPCPRAPHHTRAQRVGDELRLSTLFVVEPQLEDKVRQRIEAALAEGRLVGPGDVLTTGYPVRPARRFAPVTGPCRDVAEHASV